MSMRALLLATKARLLASPLSLADGTCLVMHDGQPPGSAGQTFYAIHPGSIQSDHDLSLDETYDLMITVTVRTDYCPHDRLGEDVITKASTGLWAKVEALRAVVHMDYTILRDANAGQSYSIGSSENGFIEPLKFLGATYLGAKDASWFWSDGHDETPAGLAVECRFGRARRAQVIEEQS
jgi:hypothetical protein